jgi:hypothetical protein
MHRIEKLKSPLAIKLHFYYGVLSIFLSPSAGSTFNFDFQCIGQDRQVSLLKRISIHCSLLIAHANANELELSGECDSQQDPQGSIIWLGFLRRFVSAQIFYVYGDDEFEIYIARVLGELTKERAMEVLPMLHTLMFKESYQFHLLVTTILKPFIDARQLSDHPVIVQWCP